MAPDTSEIFPAMMVPLRDSEDAEHRARTFEIQPGVSWRITIVARLVSEDIVLGTHSACLIVRLERSDANGNGNVLATLRANSLEEVPEAQLHSLVDRYESPARRLYAR